ncbi:MAG: efflux RND transporter periplasmic adaptor subunit [Holophagaceae bacterium]
MPTSPSSPTRFKKRLPLGWIVLGSISLVGLIAWMLSEGAALSVSTNTPTLFKKGTQTPLVTASGYIVARTRATLSSKVLGRVAYLGGQAGSLVSKGQVLAKLESPDIEASRNAIFSQVHQAQQDYDRSATLQKSGFESPANTERLLSQLNTLKAQLAYQDALLESMTLKAPFTGIVTQKLSEVGETVAPGSAGGANAINAILVMADFDTLEVEVEVSESGVGKLTPGMATEVRVDALEKKKDSSILKGHLRAIYPSSNRQKATIIVRVALDQKDPLLVPDMGAKVTFLGAPYQEDVLVLGREQVYRDPQTSESFTWVVEDGRATKKSILVLNAENPLGYEISGLIPSSQLIIAPPDNLKPGQKVTPKRL